MVEVRRMRTPEVPLVRLVIALFTLAVLGSGYYIAGGPIPYFIHWEGPPGAAFEGRYEVISDAADMSPGGGQFSSSYPYTVTVWGSRRQGVLASAQNSSEANALNTITVRRAGVVCTKLYRWGNSVDAVCGTP